MYSLDNTHIVFFIESYFSTLHYALKMCFHGRHHRDEIFPTSSMHNFSNGPSLMQSYSKVPCITSQCIYTCITYGTVPCVTLQKYFHLVLWVHIQDIIVSWRSVQAFTKYVHGYSFMAMILLLLLLRRYDEETKFSVTPSFVLTHSSDSI